MERPSRAPRRPEALGCRSVLADLGWELDIKVHTHSSAVKSIASRRGLGKTRHIEVQYLWLQQVALRSYVPLRKIKGTENVADVLTKPKGLDEYARLLSKVHVYVMRSCWSGSWGRFVCVKQIVQSGARVQGTLAL